MFLLDGVLGPHYKQANGARAKTCHVPQDMLEPWCWHSAKRSPPRLVTILRIVLLLLDSSLLLLPGVAAKKFWLPNQFPIPLTWCHQESANVEVSCFVSFQLSSPFQYTNS